MAMLRTPLGVARMLFRAIHSMPDGYSEDDQDPTSICELIVARLQAASLNAFQGNTTEFKTREESRFAGQVADELENLLMEEEFGNDPPEDDEE